MSTKRLSTTTSSWRTKHPLSRLPQLGGANWLGQGQQVDGKRPQLDDMGQEPKYEIEPSPLHAVDFGDPLGNL